MHLLLGLLATYALFGAVRDPEPSPAELEAAARAREANWWARAGAAGYSPGLVELQQHHGIGISQPWEGNEGL